MKKWYFGIAFVIALLLLTLSAPVANVSAEEPCTMFPYAPVSNSTAGTPVVHGATGASNCPTDKSRVEVWIDNNTSFRTCWIGSTYGNACAGENLGDVASAEQAGAAYGVLAGFSKHFAVQTISPYTWTQLGDVQLVTLNAGSPPMGPPRGDDPSECEEWEQWSDLEGWCIPYNSPILIPLTRSQAVKLTSAADGVYFDLNSDGVVERTAWTAADSRLAFLTIDRNSDGIISLGSELLGNYTIPNASNGFQSLAVLNAALGGAETPYINSDTPLYSKLLLWEDVNHDGISQSSELQPASNVITAIGLGYSIHNRRDGNGNLFAFRGFAHVRTAPGRNMPVEREEQDARRISIYDVFFKNQ